MSTWRTLSDIQVAIGEARERVAKEEDWLAEHGGSRAEYLSRYGAADGAVIYAADRAALAREQAILTDLEANLRDREATARGIADGTTLWSDLSVAEISDVMVDLRTLGIE